MTKKEDAVRAVREIVKGYFAAYDREQPAGAKYRVPLVSRLYGEDEVAEVVDTLLTPERVTLNASGELKVEKFERLWADFIGVRNGIMVNSGSSANMAAFYMLSNPAVKARLMPGDEVITTALTWATSVSPLYAAGLKPVFIDVKKGGCTMDTDLIEKAIGPKTRAILVVHLMGFPVDMDAVMKTARKHNLFVIEDCCEAHGAEWNGRKVGSFGDISTFSFYLSHHITTIEGGMVMTNDDELAELARIIRSQGVMRNVRSVEYRDRVNSLAPGIDPRFLFANAGYNFRPTEMEGAFGVVQFGKFGKYMETRVRNAAFFTECLSDFSVFLEVHAQEKAAKCAWFGYPIMVKKSAPFSAAELAEFLEKRGIETRPIMSGDYTRHPVAGLYEHRVSGSLDNTGLAHDNAFFIGVHAGIGEPGRSHVKACFEEFFRRY